MAYPTFGWIQNPNNFGKLKKIVQVFVPGSSYNNELYSNGLNYIYDDCLRDEFRKKIKKEEVVLTWKDMKGSQEFIPNKPRSRANQLATGIAQIAAGIPNEVKSSNDKVWTDDYTAGSFVNWALTLNFLRINNDFEIRITELGKKFANSASGTWKSSKTYESSLEEKEILKRSIGSYPPAVRIMHLLSDAKNNDELLSKFNIGSELGFSGEEGFTSFDEDEWFEYLSTLSKNDQKKFKNNGEGSADKWARGICSWLQKLDLIKTKRKFDANNDNFINGYLLTLPGEILLKKCRGNSSNPPSEKYIDWTMFATKVSNAMYVRRRRALTLKAIIKSSSLENIKDDLKSHNAYDGDGVIKSDVIGLIRFGLNIEIKQGKYIWKDRVNDFYVPENSSSVVIDDEEIKSIKDDLQNRLHNIDPRDIEIVEMAWKKSPTRSKNTLDATLFEIKVVEIMKKYIGLEGKHLGGENKPDGFIFYKNSFGIILDTKCYFKGYNLPIDQQREMQDYIISASNKIPGVPKNEWWRIIPNTITNENLNFLWVSGDYTGNYLDGVNQTHLKTGVSGGAIDVVTLLELSNSVKEDAVDVEDIPNLMNNGRILMS